MSNLEHLAPNTDGATIGERFWVETEGYKIKLEVRPVGPQTKGYLLSFVESEPPLSERSLYPSEVYVQGDEIQVGKVFELSSIYPALTKTAFTALGITPIVSVEAATTSRL